MRAHDALAQDGMRVLGLALRLVDAAPEGGAEALERDAVFVGLVGMSDPPRPEVKDAVATCLQAGIRPVMITGDHPLTARFVARQLGIGDSRRRRGHRSGTGADSTTAGLDRVCAATSVFARVSPEHKLRIVQALQSQAQVVAMTGDGVNDAPALRRADIGVAMGITGTDVSKEAADMVLRDDNFATIVAAVEEGRVDLRQHPEVHQVPAVEQLRRAVADAARAVLRPAAAAAAAADPLDQPRHRRVAGAGLERGARRARTR